MNEMRRLAVVGMGAAMLLGTANLSPMALAQSAGSAATQAPTAPVAQPQAAPATETPAAPVVAVAPQGGTIQGTVKASGVPLPGVAVTATNTLTGKKYATTTDIDGAFQMTVPQNGRYVLKTDLTGFAPATQEVVVNASSEEGGLPKQTAEFKIDLASRVAPQPAQAAAAATGTTTPAAGAVVRRPAPAARGAASGAVARVGRGTQSLAVQSNEDQNLTDASASTENFGAQLPSLSGEDTSTASNDAIAVTGQQGQINGLATFSQEDLQNRIMDMQRNGFNNGDIAGTLSGVMQTGNFPAGPGGPGGGGPGGPGGGGFAGGGGFGGGGFGGGRGGGFARGGGFGGGFGGFRGQNPNAWHGSLAYNGYNSTLDANSRSATGNPIPKPYSSQNSLTVSLTGTPYIVGLIAPNPKQFVFLSVSESRTNSPSAQQFLVPTPAQRLGDLTPAYQAGQVINGTVYDPSTGNPYSNTGCDPALAAIDPNPTACIPYTELNSSALALLNYYPAPNVTSPLDNYQANFPATSHSASVSARYNRSFGATPMRGGRGFGGGRGGAGGGRGQSNAKPTLHQSIAENFAYSHNANATSSFSPLLGGQSVSNGYSLSSGYTVGYGRLNSTSTLSWNRSRSLASNYFTNGSVNPAISADNNIPAPGIYVGPSQVYSNPFFYGVPSVGISGGIQGLSEAVQPNDTISQTISFSEMVSWVHNRNNMRYGFDFHRIHQDTIGGSGALGSFTFSGFATENPAAQHCVGSACSGIANSGSSMADFLLGLPQNSNVSADLNKIYLRGNAWDWYAQDDWRAKPNLTVSYGLRWEYFSPYTELDNRLVNLNVTGIGTNNLAVSTICGTQAPPGTPAGYCDTVQPGTLVNPDKSAFSPRVAVAWTPRFTSRFAAALTKNTVVRSSFGINYNTGAYSSFASKLALQQPFSITQKNVQESGSNPSTGCTPANMTLSNGFGPNGNGCSTQVTQSSYAVDPNYRMGQVEVWNLGIQRTLPQGVVLNVDYTGSYAGNLDMLRAPNRTPSGLIVQSVGQFNYEDSLGYQRMNALAVNARERMHKGVSLQATYTLAHSIDDASSVGGSGGGVAQNDQDLNAEEANSSFVRRQVLNGSFIIEPPFGPNRAFLNKGGVLSHILDGFSISGNFSFASGTLATPTYTATAAEISAGANSLRPNRVPGQPIKGARTIGQWFNPDAFAGLCSATPAPDATQLPYCLADNAYGNSSRDSIEMPPTKSLNGSLSRTFSFGGTRSLETRLIANNALNTARYSGISTQINSTQYGQVLSYGPMRSLSYRAQFRF